MNTPESSSGSSSIVPPAPKAWALYGLAVLAVATLGVYVAVAALSTEFSYALDEVNETVRAIRRSGLDLGHPLAQQALREPTERAAAIQAARPIPLILTLFGAAFVLYLVALALAVRAPAGRGLVWAVFGGAVAFRLTLLFSTPILESDIYRYIWDGNATCAGVSPFRYAPQKALEVPQDEGELGRLARLRDEVPAVRLALKRIQYAQVPTVYPPVSQGAFALAAWLTPDDAPLQWHILAMKVPFVAFDLATVLLLLFALPSLGRHPGWSVAYAWCPLVLKEVANSGHLDSIAMFFTTLGLVLAARALGPWGGLIGRREKARAAALMTLAALSLALGVGSKLYPLVLLPLLAATWMRSPGWRRAWVPGAAFVAASVVVCWPMLPSRLPPSPGKVRHDDPSAGVQMFLRHWEMNDLIFRVLKENARPQGNAADAWYVVVPQRWREALQQQTARLAGVEAGWAPFLVARVLTALAFLVAAGWLAYRAVGADTPARWLECAFLTLAWFWLLSPAQNPWYWLWALPLLPFARGRAWLVVSGFAFVYYLRFWPPVGAAYFDDVLVWLEYAPWLLWLLLAWAVRHRE